MRKREVGRELVGGPTSGRSSTRPSTTPLLAGTKHCVSCALHAETKREREWWALSSLSLSFFLIHFLHVSLPCFPSESKRVPSLERFLESTRNWPTPLLFRSFPHILSALALYIVTWLYCASFGSPSDSLASSRHLLRIPQSAFSLSLSLQTRTSYASCQLNAKFRKQRRDKTLLGFPISFCLMALFY